MQILFATYTERKSVHTLIIYVNVVPTLIKKVLDGTLESYKKRKIEI